MAIGQSFALSVRTPDDPISKIADLTVAYGLLNAKQQELETFESELIDALQEGTASDQEITKEYDESDKFSGNVRDWLKFWSLFEKIHEDTKLDNEDKFHYLMHAVELVTIYPLTGDNYTFGVTTDKCVAMFFPLVESALPEEILRLRYKVNNVSPWLRKDSNETIVVKLVDRSQMKKAQSTAKNVTRARNLLTKGKEITCIFCEKNNHDSAKCTKAKSMSSDERQEATKKHRACFRCLKIGHGSRLCHVNTKCSKCSRRHVDIMYFGEQKLEDSTKNEKCVSLRKR
ncbi:hypothetical protein TSAR_011097 [Trichomalopsis sarcophagae]|uniref:CCHC-type domain-containing protein n=1 Tax=Trichomalopsis sarcophagae TaxID=543379 RepID=A0A232ELU4_9HYME|nr:hypothetical protein TSAR_011097 [Trichomalopsis sarcophagae]